MNLVSLLSGIIVIIVEIIVIVPLLQKSSCCMTAESSQKKCDDLLWKPELDTDGSFSAVQCKGEDDDGRCFCYNSGGSRIFGWSWLSSQKNMTCRCSRQRHRLITQLGRNDVSLHCTQNGNYERLQCDNGLCWCVEPMSGKPKERFYPQSMMKHLPCYTENFSEAETTKEEEQKQQLQQQQTSPPRYLRQCESKALARIAILKKLETHGRLDTHIDEARCDGDGSYATHKIEKKRLCTRSYDLCGRKLGNDNELSRQRQLRELSDEQWKTFLRRQ